MGGDFAGQRVLSDQVDIRKNNMSFFNKLKEGFNTSRSELAKQVGRVMVSVLKKNRRCLVF